MRNYRIEPFYFCQQIIDVEFLKEKKKKIEGNKP